MNKDVKREPRYGSVVRIALLYARPLYRLESKTICLKGDFYFSFIFVLQYWICMQNADWRILRMWRYSDFELEWQRNVSFEVFRIQSWGKCTVGDHRELFVCFLLLWLLVASFGPKSNIMSVSQLKTGSQCNFFTLFLTN